MSLLTMISAARLYLTVSLVVCVSAQSYNRTLWANSTTLNFTTSGNYTFDNEKVNVTGGKAVLKQVDQTDDDNDATLGFGAATHNGTQYDTVNNWLELNSSTNVFELPGNADANGWIDMTGNILLLHMDESAWTGVANEVIDSSGQGNHGTRMDDLSPTAANAGKLNRAADFDGSNDGINVGNPTGVSGATNFTFMTWFKLDSGALGNDYDIFAKGNHGTGIPFLIWRDDSASQGDQSGNTNCISAFVHDGADTKWISSPTNSANDTQWHHLVLTFEANSATGWIMYFDGVAVATGDTTAVDFIETTSTNITLGIDNSSARDWIGDMDEVAMWTRTLSATEVQLIYDRQKSDYSGESTSRVMDVNASTSWSNINWTTPYPMGKQLPDNRAVESGYTAGNIDMSNNVLLLHFNETEANSASGGTDAEDSSGQGNHGTESGGVDFGWPSNLNTGFDFDGTDEYVNVGNAASLQITDNITVMGWVKGAAGQETVAFVSRYDHGAGDRSWYMGSSAAASDGASNRLRVIVSDDGSFTSKKQFASSVVVLDGSWHHVAFTFASGTLKLYVDGVEDTSVIVSADDGITSIHSGATDVVIGSRLNNGASDGQFDGLIDEVAIFNNVLGADEILSAYRRGTGRLQIQVRSDDDNSNWGPFVGPDGTRNTYFSELTNATGTPATTALSGVSNNPYFQYRVSMANNNSTQSPELQSVSITPSHYFGGGPTIYNTTGISYTSLQSFSAIAGAGNAGTLQYQLSNNGSTWYYHNGTTWTTAASTANSNTATNVNTHITTFVNDVGTGNLHVRAILNSDTTQLVELDRIDIVHDVTLAFTHSEQSLDEDAGAVGLALTRSAALSTTSTVNYAITTSTATANSDYTFSSGTATFAASSTTTTIPFTVLEDTADEGIETVIITLSSPTNGILGTNTTTTLRIIDNDEPPAGVPSASIPDPIGQAPHDVTISVTEQSNAIAYLWDFNNDGIADQVTTTPSASHQYLEAGSYTIDVIVVLADGSTATTGQDVVVSAAASVPTARITQVFTDNNNRQYDAGVDTELDSDVTNLEGSTITASPGQFIGFKGEATATHNIISWQWDFTGNGAVNHIESNVTESYGFYTFNTAGTYLAKLTVTEDDGAGTAVAADSTTVIIRINAPSASDPKLWITQPQTNQRVSGDAVSIEVKFSPSSAFDLSSANIEINSGSGWQSAATLGVLTTLNTMTDAVLFSLDTSQLTNGTYSMRASADSAAGVNISSGTSGNQEAISITVVDTGADISENSDGSQSIVITPTTESDMHQGEDTLIGISLGTVPADRTLSVTRFTTDPVNDVTTADSRLLTFVNEWREIKLLDSDNAETQPEKPVTVRIYYDDENNDGIVDGTSTAEGALSIYRYTNGSWMELLNVTRNATDNYIEGQTPGFSFFSVATATSSSSTSTGGTAGITSGLTSGGGGGGGCLINTLR